MSPVSLSHQTRKSSAGRTQPSGLVRPARALRAPRSRARSRRCSSIDKRVWKLIKQRENVRVFAQRKNQSGGGGIDEIRESIDSFSGSGAVQPSDLPVVLTVGSIAGTLDDLMHGLMCPTVEVMRIKTSYIDDRFAEAAVLHTIAAPISADAKRHEAFNKRRDAELVLGDARELSCTTARTSHI